MINYYIIFQVKHSQRTTEKNLAVWVIFQEDGSVCTAHCTCMAGTSEVCSHVGAILFAAEYATKMKEDVSCTGVKAAWPVPATKNVPIIPVSQMKWGKPTTQPTASADIPPIQDGEIIKNLNSVEEAGCSSALMRIIEPFASNVTQVEEVLPTLFNIFDENYVGKSYNELIILTKTINFNISQAEITKIEEATRTQRKSNNWFNQHVGRITASKFKKQTFKQKKFNPT
jgi:hypothetical protein